jgi:hypothetical protein
LDRKPYRKGRRSSEASVARVRTWIGHELERPAERPLRKRRVQGIGSALCSPFAARSRLGRQAPGPDRAHGQGCGCQETSQLWIIVLFINRTIITKVKLRLVSAGSAAFRR